MQTFLPYSDFNKSAACLDWRRLGKQRVEAMQILRALENQNYGWQNHPAVNMWRGFEAMLAVYHNTIIDEWTSRGYRNNMKLITPHIAPISPTWMGNLDFHASHRSNLLRKDPEHYGQYGWTETDNLPYIWGSEPLDG
ncbi:MAG: MSMEG_6728 family protein [Dehalococcoidia bacterium]|nr:MSMEG_6728 family protein [Dehalococcoidia bacterium]